MIIRVIGCGNLLVGDDGFGIRVIEELRKKDLPGDVELLEGAVRGLNLIDYFLDADKVIIIDAVILGKEKGEFHRLVLDDLLKMSRDGITSLHQIGIAEVLTVATKLYTDQLCQNIVLIGVEVELVKNEFSMELSPEIKKVLPEAIELIIQEINKEY